MPSSRAKKSASSKQSTLDIEIKELDPNIIPPLRSRYQDPDYSGGSKIVVCGAPGRGKSTLIKSLLYFKKDIFPAGMVMSGSEDSKPAFAEFMPDTFIYNKYDDKALTHFIERQKLSRKHLENPWAVIILDDCTDDPSVFNRPLQQAMYKKGRHWSMFYILSLQYAMDVRPVIRTNIDGIFILRDPLLKNRENLYKNYASIIPTFDIFCQLMDQITEDFHALYIHSASHTNVWQDCVFYYKAPLIPSSWKFGCEDYWEFHKQRFDENYTTPFII